MSGSVAAIIPARLGSSRLPEKPLLQDTGKYLIQHVYENVSSANRIDRVIVATDDQKILDAVLSFGGDAVLTSTEHQSGTDRVAEVTASIDADYILNVQGDEPCLSAEDLDRVVDALLGNGGEIVTLAVPITDETTYHDPHSVKVVMDTEGKALYFTRNPAPWADSFDGVNSSGLAHKHLGIYGFSRELLFRFTSLERSALEKIERLEQLRAMHHGMPIRVLVTDEDPVGIDTREDYDSFVEKVREQTRTST